MTRLHELLPAVIAAPDDDGPRLVCSDALQQLGDPRGEFIGLQCRLARAELAGDERRAARRRERALYGEHRRCWIDELGMKSWLRLASDFRRGFVEEVVIGADELVSLGEGLFAATPLRALTVVEADPASLDVLLGLPGFSRLRALRFRDGGALGDAAAIALAASPRVSSLETLSLHGACIGEAGARALAASPNLPRLAVLDVSGSQIGEGGARAFLEQNALAALHELYISFGANPDMITWPLSRKYRLFRNGEYVEPQ